MKRILLALAVCLAAAPAASAGGWATVGLGSLPPDDLRAGGTWSVELTVLQHARTPLEGIAPSVTLRGDGGELAGPFVATPTGKAGVYRADVTFPAAGRWAISVDDDFSRVHSFAPVEIAPPASPSSFPALPVGGAALALLGAAALALVVRRVRHAPQPAPSA